MIGGGSKGIWKLVVTSERDLALLNCIELIFPSAIYCCNLDSRLIQACTFQYFNINIVSVFT